MNLEKTSKQTGYVKSFDDLEVYYEVRGDQKETIVFVYGIACVMNHWQYQMNYLSKKYKIVSFDIRGHHNTKAPADLENQSIDAVAKDIKAILNHLGVQKAHFAGHSFGVPILIQTFNEYPEIFNSMILANGFAVNPMTDMFGINMEKVFSFIKIQREANPAVWKFLWKTLIDNPFSGIISGLAGGFNLNLTQHKDIEIYLRGVSRLELEPFIKLFGEMLHYDGTEVLAKINVPTLIISGEKDFVTPPKYQLQLRDHIKNSELLTVPYGSHCTQLDFADYMNLKMEHFLNSI